MKKLQKLDKSVETRISRIELLLHRLKNSVATRSKKFIVRADYNDVVIELGKLKYSLIKSYRKYNKA